MGDGTMCARPSTGVTLACVPDTGRRPQKPGVAARAAAFAVSASGNGQGDKYLTGIGEELLCDLSWRLLICHIWSASLILEIPVFPRRGKLSLERLLLQIASQQLGKTKIK